MRWLDEETWAEVHRLYSEEGRSFAVLAVEFGLTRYILTKRAKSEGWVKGILRRDGPGARQTSARMPALKSRRVIMARLYRAITRKLEHMEARMMRGESRSAQDEERDQQRRSRDVRRKERE